MFIKDTKAGVQVSNTIEFMADKAKVTGPKVDGGYTVSFDVGEYEQDKVSQLIALPQGEILRVEVSNG